MKTISSWQQGAILAAGLVVSVGFAASMALADGVQDFYHQMNQKRFFNNLQGARTAAMAGSSVATSSDSSSILGNPAGLGWMKDAEVAASYMNETVSGNDLMDYSKIDGTTNGGYAVGAFPIKPYEEALPEYGNIGLGWSGYRTDSDDSLDLDYRRWQLHAAYAKALNAAWSVGYSFSYDNLKTDTFYFDEEMNDGIRQAVGAQYKMSERTMFGLSTHYGFGRGKVKDLLPQFSDEFDELNRKVRSWGVEGGVAQTVFTNTLLTASVDYTGYWQNIDSDSSAWGFRLGAEQPIVDWFKLRAGYRYQANLNYDMFDDGDNENAKFNAVSFGAGVNITKYARVDYAAEYRAISDGDWSHWVTLSIPFSICK